MEMLIGCIFLGIILVILTIFCKNITLNVKIEYPAPQYIEVKDPYNPDGEPKEHDKTATIDDLLKEVNNIMLGREGETDE